MVVLQPAKSKTSNTMNKFVAIIHLNVHIKAVESRWLLSCSRSIKVCANIGNGAVLGLVGLRLAIETPLNYTTVISTLK